MKITTISKGGLALIKRWESFRAKPYLCPAGVPTIGWGTTRYPDGRKVKLNDAPVTEAVAEKYLLHDVIFFAQSVDNYCRDDISQNQFDALVSFTYNVGAGALKRSTLLAMVNAEPYNPKIKDQFLRWNKAAGRILKGLTARREEEAKLYFIKKTIV